MELPRPLQLVINFVKGFLNWLGRVLRAYLISVGLFVTLGPVVLLGALHFFKGKAIQESRQAVVSKGFETALVTLKFQGDLTDHEQGASKNFLEHLFRSHSDYYLGELRATLRHLAQDNRVKGLHVTVQSLGGSFAEFSELRRILVTFKASGKPVNFYLEDADERSLYLASAGDRIVVAPTTEIMIPGPSFSLAYFGDALKKIGVDVEVMRAGKYKSAFEPFVANKPSPETVEEYRTMGGSMLDHIVSKVAEGRKQSPEIARTWFRQSLFSPSQAVKSGILDGVGYEDDEVAMMQKQVAAAEELEFADYQDEFEAAVAKSNDKSATGKAGIALIEAIGEIHLSDSDGGRDDAITPSQVAKEVDWALEDEDVKAVVLRVSSPGGSALASDLILQNLKRLAAKKPIVVSMGAYAASGGYWMSMASKKIFAEALTITGSIGVISMRPNFSGFESKYGVSFFTVTESERVNLINPGAKASTMDKALLAGSIDEVYQMFLATVAAGRNLPVEKVGELAQGRVYTGDQAIKLGLVDEIGGLHESFQAAKELAGFDRNLLYPILKYREDVIPMNMCFRNSNMMMKCLQQLDGTVKSLVGTVVDEGKRNSGMPEMRFAQVAQRWAALAQESRVLVLWPGSGVNF